MFILIHILLYLLAVIVFIISTGPFIAKAKIRIVNDAWFIVAFNAFIYAGYRIVADDNLSLLYIMEIVGLLSPLLIMATNEDNQKNWADNISFGIGLVVTINAAILYWLAHTSNQLQYFIIIVELIVLICSMWAIISDCSDDLVMWSKDIKQYFWNPCKKLFGVMFHKQIELSDTDITLNQISLKEVSAKYYKGAYITLDTIITNKEALRYFMETKFKHWIETLSIENQFYFQKYELDHVIRCMGGNLTDWFTDKKLNALLGYYRDKHVLQRYIESMSTVNESFPFDLGGQPLYTAVVKIPRVPVLQGLTLNRGIIVHAESRQLMDTDDYEMSSESKEEIDAYVADLALTKLQTDLFQWVMDKEQELFKRSLEVEAACYNFNTQINPGRVAYANRNTASN